MEVNSDYWIIEATESYKTAVVLFENKRYLESAFFCHLAVEKILKAFISFRQKTIPPKIHNLLSLANRAGLDEELSEEKLDFLADLNIYQLEGRYPGDRELLFTQTPVDKFKSILNNTEGELSWLKQKLKSEISSSNI